MIFACDVRETRSRCRRNTSSGGKRVPDAVQSSLARRRRLVNDVSPSLARFILDVLPGYSKEPGASMYRPKADAVCGPRTRGMLDLEGTVSAERDRVGLSLDGVSAMRTVGTVGKKRRHRAETSFAPLREPMIAELVVASGLAMRNVRIAYSNRKASVEQVGAAEQVVALRSRMTWWPFGADIAAEDLEFVPLRPLKKATSCASSFNGVRSGEQRILGRSRRRRLERRCSNGPRFSRVE